MAAALKTALVALAAAVLVGADNSVPALPYDAQDGVFRFPVTCEILGAVNQTFNTLFTAVAPIFGGTGQEIYYTDVVGHIDIPDYITNIGRLVGASQAQVNVTVYLKLTNASPSNLLLFNVSLNNVGFSTNGSDTVLRLPAGNDTFPPLGPVTLGEANVTHRILIGDVNVELQLQKSNGQNVLDPIPITCGQQNIDFIIGSVNVNDTAGLPPFAPANGFTPPFPDTPVLYETGFYRFGYDCDFGPLGPQTVELIIGGTIGAYFQPGEEFYMTNATSFILVPESLVKLAKEAFSDLSTFDTTVTLFELGFTNASPESYNVASPEIDSSVAAPSGDTGLTIPLPLNGFLPAIGPITAGNSGTIVIISAGSANATSILRNSTGDALLTLPITCSPPSALELIGIPISSLGPGNYSLGIGS